MTLLNRQEVLNPKYNPKGSYRPGQLATLVSLFGAIHNGYKFLALNAPTGAGKSIIATSLANLLGGSHILTTQIKLQEQYLTLGDDYERVLGRPNFSCISSRNTKMANNGLCIEQDYRCSYSPQKNGRAEAFGQKYWKFSEENRQCKYWKNVEIGSKAKHVIFNYAYYVLKMNNILNQDFPTKPIQILDEGHNLEAYIRNIASFEIHNFSLRNLDYSHVPRNIDDVETAIKWMKEVKEAVDKLLPGLEEQEVCVEDLQQSRKTISQLRSLRDRLSWTITKHKENPKNWVFYDLETGFKLAPLYIGDYIYDILFTHSGIKLIMSATLPNKKTLCKRLGLKEKEVFYYSMPSTFPPENAPIYTYGQPTMTWDPDMKPKRDKMGMRILKHMRANKDKRGLILVNSFDEVLHYTNYIYKNDNEQFKRLTIHNRGDKQEYLLEDHARKKSSVIISPSMWEGVDLTGKLGEFLLICKVPYADFKDPLVQGWKELDPQRYFEDTVQKIRQGVGRVVRSQEDIAEIHIEDGNFKRLYNYNKKEFPKEFTDRVV